MSILTIILVLVAVGVILWLVNSYIPMQPTIKKILNIVIIIIVVIWLLRASGLWASLSGARI